MLSHLTQLNILELCNLYGTDKGTVVPPAHNYAALYDEWFAPLRSTPIRLLEIGATYKHPFASMKVWSDYFINANLLVCYDIDEWVVEIPRVRTFQGNQQSKEDWLRFYKLYGGEFDIIIDDGCHQSGSQISAFNYALPLLKSGGMYIVEDIMYDDAWWFFTNLASKDEQYKNIAKVFLYNPGSIYDRLCCISVK